MKNQELYKNEKLSPKERARDLLSHMTLREKVGQLNQRLYGFESYIREGDSIRPTQEFMDEAEKWGGIGVLYGLYRADPWSKRDFDNGIPPRLAAKAYNVMQRCALERSRLKIPMLMSSECPHGHQAPGGYLLPVNLALGATFHPELVKSAYSVCGKQLKAQGVDLALISVLDVLRDPRWGRSEECYGEDPYLCAQLAQATVEGCQGEGVDVVAKHFCAQGEGTGGINASAARIGMRELREIHLPPAKACCKAKAAGVMAAYNEIDGVLCHANPSLLNGILREEMGFEGVVMADGTAIDRLDDMTGDSTKSGAMALKSGVDISLWDVGFTKLEEAVEKGYVPLERLDEAVLRVLELKFARGLFEKPYLDETPAEGFSYEAYPQSVQLARESAVLLKNEGGVLPLSAEKIKSIAVIGPNADRIYNQLGDYTPPLQNEGITLLEGIRRLVPSVRVEYSCGCGLSADTDREEIQRARALAEECDAVILALGGSSSRFGDVRFDVNGAAMSGNDLSMDCGEGMDISTLRLSGAQEELAQEIFSTGKPVITVCIAGRPYAIEAVSNESQALLYAFYPGPMGGQALAEILFGVCSPSGRLPVSIPRHAGQLPVYYNSKSSYAAMRYWDAPHTPLYPFGFGLGYAEFLLEAAAVSHTELSVGALSQGEVFTLRARVHNRSAIAGAAVLQLYIRAKQGSVVRRCKELKAFQKVFAEAQGTAEAVLTLDAESLSVWDAQMRFCVEPAEIEWVLSDGAEPLKTGTLTLVP